MPFGGVNPSIRAYDYDVNGKRIMNYQQHYLPLDELYSSDSKSQMDSQLNTKSSLDEFLVSGDRRSRNSKFMKNPSSPNRKKRDSTPNEKQKKKNLKGRGTPHFLSNPDNFKCLDNSTNTLCLPESPPKDCKQRIWKKLKI